MANILTKYFMGQLNVEQNCDGGPSHFSFFSYSYLLAAGKAAL